MAFISDSLSPHLRGLATKKDKSPGWCLSEFCQVVNGWSWFGIYCTILILCCSQVSSNILSKKAAHPKAEGL
jgi:hypothetical protein